MKSTLILQALLSLGVKTNPLFTDICSCNAKEAFIQQFVNNPLFHKNLIKKKNRFPSKQNPICSN